MHNDQGGAGRRQPKRVVSVVLVDVQNGGEAVSAPTEQDFELACKRHDLTYHYSDDIAVWRSGEAQYTALKAMAEQLPREVVVRIYNRVVDEKILSDHRDQFYWH